MGVHGVQLYHDHALFKPAGGKATPWHQGQFYWPLETNHTITMWMPLIDVSQKMGTMSFASGSQALCWSTAPCSEQERFFLGNSD